MSDVLAAVMRLHPERFSRRIAASTLAVVVAVSVTLSGTPAFSSSYAYAGSGAVLQLHATTFSGSATGPRYTATALGVVFVGGAGASYLPGNAAGTGTSPGTSLYGLYL